MIYGFSGKIKSGKNTAATIWQILSDSYYYNMEPDELYSNILKELNNPGELRLKSRFQQKAFGTNLKFILSFLTGCGIESLNLQDFKSSQLPKEWEFWEVFQYDTTDPEIMVQRHLFSNEEAANTCVKHLNKLSNTVVIADPPYRKLYTYREALQYIGTELFQKQFHPDVWVYSLFKEIYSHNSYLITDVRHLNEAKAIKDRDGKIIRINRDKAENRWAHSSETQLDKYEFDYVIDNNGSILDLINSIKEIMIKEGIIDGKV